MIRSRYFKPIAALGALMAGIAGHAAPSDEMRLRPAWQALDRNHDGKVTFDEVDPLQAPFMRRSDMDGDGALSLAEYAAYDLDPGNTAAIPLPANVRLIADLPYAGTTDPRQRLDIFLPKTPGVAGPLPVIAYVHGGGWSIGSKTMARTQVAAPVNSGRYAAVSIGYRLSWQDPWPAQIEDVKAAIRWIRAHAAEYGFDPNRICAMGPSAGGQLVAKLGLTNDVAAAEGRLGRHLDQSSRVQCVVDAYGPVDLETIVASGSPERRASVAPLFAGDPAQHAGLVHDASPIFDVRRGAPPFLVIHGTDDKMVDYGQSVKLVAALRKAGVPVSFQTIEGGGHADFGAATSEVAARTTAFLDSIFYDPNTLVRTDPLRK